MSGANIADGRKMAVDAHAWMESHEADFMALLGFVRGLRARGVKGRVRDHAALFCIDHRIKVGTGSKAFANALWAGIERYMVLLDPSLEGYPIRMTDSVIDCYGLIPVSWMEKEEPYVRS